MKMINTGDPGRRARQRSLRALAAAAAASAMLLAGAQPALAIHDGTKATTEAQPWMVAIESPDGVQFCGGTVVRATYVLTAAHCVDGDDPRELRVVVGRTDLRTDDGVVRRVRGIWIHPDYEQVAERVDLALLELQKPVDAPPLRLATKQQPADEIGTIAAVFGWGRTGPGQQFGSPVLRTTSLEVSELKACEPYTGPEDDPAERLCAMPPADGEESICNGDSGGPLVADQRLIGVVSTGNKFCDSQLPVSVFARVSTAAKSLRQQMNQQHVG